MKNLAILSLVLAAASGCGQKEVPVTDNQQQEDTKESEPSGHKDHKHAFTDPAERAKKWNDPQRDHWQRPVQMIAALALKPGATVVDLGAGTGYMVAYLSKAVGNQGTVIALDASAEMIAYLTKRIPDLGPARIVPRKVGIDDPELQPASVDAVLTLDTWHHLKEREAYARKIYAGLKQGGRFVVVDFEPDSEIGPPKEMRISREQVSQQLESAGFRIEVARESMPRHYMIVGHKD